jgi:hypothetical protein
MLTPKFDIGQLVNCKDNGYNRSYRSEIIEVIIGKSYILYNVEGYKLFSEENLLKLNPR